MKTLLALLSGFVSFLTYGSTGWSQIGTITEVYNHGYTVMVKVSGTNVNHTESCERTDYYAIDNSDSSAFDILFSQILMAHASGKSVRFWVDGNVCSGQGKKYQTIRTMRSYSS